MLCNGCERKLGFATLRDGEAQIGSIVEGRCLSKSLESLSESLSERHDVYLFVAVAVSALSRFLSEFEATREEKPNIRISVNSLSDPSQSASTIMFSSS